MSSRQVQYRRLAHIALREFPEIVVGTETIEGKLRIFIADNSFIDVWLSEKRRGVYAYHWERRMSTKFIVQPPNPSHASKVFSSLRENLTSKLYTQPNGPKC